MVYSTNQNKTSILYDKQCYLEDEKCTLMLNESDVVIEFSTFPVLVEEMMKVVVSHENRYVLKQGWLEGTNMFMGRTTLFLIDKTSTEGHISINAELFIGSCSEPNMRWKLLLDLDDQQTGQTHTVSVFFQTSR